MKRKLLLLVTLAIVFVSPLAYSGLQNSGVNATQTVKPNALTSGQTINIGFLTPQSGGLSAYTQGFQNGGTLAAMHLNDTYSDYNWVLTFYDTQTTETGASAAMTQAIDDGSAYVVGAAGSSNTLSAAALAKSSAIPLISYASTSPELSTFDDSGYLYRVCPSDAYQGQADADLAVEAGYETAVTVHLDNAYGIGIADQFETSFTAAGGEVLSTFPYAEEKTDFSTEISEIEAKDPDVVFLVAYATDGSNFFTQLADQGISVPVIGTDGIADNDIFDEQTGTQDAMDKVVATKPTSVASDAVTAFQDAYDAEFPGETGIYIAEAYDAVMAGGKAVIAADSTTGSDIKAELDNLDYAGASGQVKFDENGDVLGAAYDVLEVQGEDGFTSVGSWVDGTLTLESGFTQEALNQSSGNPLPFSFLSFFFGLTSFATIVYLRRRK